MSDGPAFVELDVPDGRSSNSTLNGKPKPSQDASAIQKQHEVHFKASHGIIVAFFTLVLSVASNLSVLNHS